MCHQFDNKCKSNNQATHQKKLLSIWIHSPKLLQNSSSQKRFSQFTVTQKEICATTAIKEQTCKIFGQQFENRVIRLQVLKSNNRKLKNIKNISR